MTHPALDKIIDRLQSCIVAARAMQLMVLERVLSIALLEAYEIKIKSSADFGKGLPRPGGPAAPGTTHH